MTAWWVNVASVNSSNTFHVSAAVPAADYGNELLLQARRTMKWSNCLEYSLSLVGDPCPSNAVYVWCIFTCKKGYRNYSLAMLSRCMLRFKTRFWCLALSKLCSRRLRPRNASLLATLDLVSPTPSFSLTIYHRFAICVIIYRPENHWNWSIMEEPNTSGNTVRLTLCYSYTYNMLYAWLIY